MKAGAHKVPCVIRLTNMGEMDRSAKTPSQLLGDLDRLHRHFREVDRNDDVLNVQRFHAHSMKSLQLAGSALLAKIEAFFALRLAAMHSLSQECGQRCVNCCAWIVLTTKLDEPSCSDQFSNSERFSKPWLSSTNQNH